jgi:hypothetical protein
MTLEQKLEKLPAYLYCDNEECDNERHYLVFNKDIQGHWTCGYVEFTTHSGILTGNEFKTMEEAVDALAKELHVTFTENPTDC